jgi:hypothetical protein
MDREDKIVIIVMWLTLAASIWAVPFLLAHDLEILCRIGAAQ